MTTTLVPAYGRDYKTAKAVKADWDANKDFIISNFFSPDDGRAINKQDTSGSYNIRFDRLTKITTVKGN